MQQTLKEVTLPDINHSLDVGEVHEPCVERMDSWSADAQGSEQTMKAKRRER
ncbi:MAG: hypothetical protein NUW22_03865 [Acidobacteria bacterium]|nr:hypothetical protein [Acidobacteriota bacterium]